MASSCEFKMIGQIDPDVEGFKDYEKQRDQSVKFTWWHNHAFGAFGLEGETGTHEQSPIKISFLPFLTGGFDSFQEVVFEHPGHGVPGLPVLICCRVHEVLHADGFGRCGE